MRDLLPAGMARPQWISQPGGGSGSSGLGVPSGDEPMAAAREPIVPLCAFAVGEEQYVLDVMRISSIVRPLRVSPVPHAPPFVEGVVSLRSQIVPVVDLRRRLGVPPAPLGPKSRMIVASVQGRQVALTVDRVIEVMRIPRSAIRPVPGIIGTGRARFLLGVCQEPGPTPGPLRFLLNAKALLDSSSEVLIGEQG